jgi:hypothetical protein
MPQNAVFKSFLLSDNHTKDALEVMLNRSVTQASNSIMDIDAHRSGVEGGIKVYPPSKIFAKLVNKNAIIHQKGVPSPKKISQPLYTLLPEIGQKLH